MKHLVLFALGLISILNNATSQIIDSTFGINGKVVTDLTSQVDAIKDLVLREDGRMLALGIGGSYLTLTQYLSNGTLDTTFGKKGKLVTTYRSEFISANGTNCAIQPDGKILLLGSNTIQNENNLVLARFKANGTTLDSTFGLNGVVKNSQFTGYGNSRSVINMILLSTGKIMVTVNTYKNQILLYRFQSNGALDLTFGNNGILTVSVPTGYTYFYGIGTAVMDSGDISLLTTIADSLYSNINFSICQFNSDGTLNANFGDNGFVIGDLGTTQQDSPTSIKYQKDGKLIVSGYTTNSNGKFVSIRYTIDGELDSTFNRTGVSSVITGGSYRTCSDLIIEDGGELILAGSIGDDYACVRLKSNGSIDSAFGNNGIFKKDFGNSYDYGTQIVQQTDGNYVLAGYTSYFCSDRAFGLVRFGLNRILSNNELETGNNIVIYPNPTTSNLNLHSDIKILSIQLDDIHGRTLEINQVNELNYSFDFTTKSNGIYLLKIRTEQGLSVEKVLKY